MKSSRFWLGVVVVCAGSLALSACKQTPPIELTIFHTNDIHSHMLPPKSDEFGLGGMARLSTLLTQLRAKHPLSITLDAGDWSEGSWMYTVDTGENMLRAMTAMKYDATVVGNHDYLAGPDRLLQVVTEANPPFPVLVSNFDMSSYANAAQFQSRIPGTAILERGGLKIGLIGVTVQDYPFAPFLKPVVATDPIQAAIAQAKILRPKVDILIVMSHIAFENNVELARLVPGVDAVISGHSHVKKDHAVMVTNDGRQVPVVETGDWGRFLGELTLTYDPSTKAVAFKNYQLHPVDPSLAEDPAIAKIVAEQKSKLDEFYGGDVEQVVADTTVPLDIDDAHEASLGDLNSKAYRDATGADIGMEAMPLSGVKVPSGPLTVFDLHDSIPHIYNVGTGKEWTVKIWNARGQDIGLIMNILYTGVNYFTSYGAGIVGVDGLEVTWKPKIGNAPPVIESMTVDGKPFDLGARYKVALTDGMLLALNLVESHFHIGLDLSQVEETGIEGWRAVLAYGEKVKHFTAKNLQDGGRSYTTVADPAIFKYSIAYATDGLAVQVFNAGLGHLDTAKVECSAGPVNDVVGFDTDDEVFNAVGEADVDGLDAGAATVVHIPWAPGMPGAYPVKCEIVAPIDGYLGNSTALTVVRVNWN